MRYFVTGATGFIGGRLAHRLLDDGHQVVAIVRDPNRAAALAERGAELHTGDITHRESLRAPMEGVDGVYHLAAWNRTGSDPSPARAINVDGTRNVLETMRDHGIAKGVYTSTVTVFSDTRGVVADESYRHDRSRGFLSTYDRTKYEAHYDVALPLIDEGLPLVIVQPGPVYGPGDTGAVGEAFENYLLGKLPMLIRGTTLTWAHIDDVVEGHILAMERGVVGESYIIAGPTHTLIDAIETAERITGIPAPRMRASPATIRAIAAVTGLIHRVVPLSGTYHPEALRVSAGVTYLADNGKARRELGYDPRPLEEGLRETLRYDMERLGIAPRATGTDV